MKLVDGWKSCWRWLSVQAMVAAGAVQGAWTFVPDDMRASFPTNWVHGVTGALLILGVVGRMVDQTPKDPPA